MVPEKPTMGQAAMSRLSSSSPWKRRGEAGAVLVVSGVMAGVEPSRRVREAMHGGEDEVRDDPGKYQKKHEAEVFHEEARWVL